jgi:hypothetical protein
VESSLIIGPHTKNVKNSRPDGFVLVSEIRKEKRKDMGDRCKMMDIVLLLGQEASFLNNNHYLSLALSLS